MTDTFDADTTEEDEDAVIASDLIDPATARPRLCREQCSTCVYRPGNPMQLRPGGLKALSEEARQSFVPCHDTLPWIADFGPSMCRGWYDGYADQSPTIQTLIEVFGEPVEVDPPPAAWPAITEEHKGS
jgi:hypothetical protein